MRLTTLRHPAIALSLPTPNPTARWKDLAEAVNGGVRSGDPPGRYESRPLIRTGRWTFSIPTSPGFRGMPGSKGFRLDLFLELQKQWRFGSSPNYNLGPPKTDGRGGVPFALTDDTQLLAKGVC